MGTIKISQLPNIGNAVTTDTLVPVVNTTGTLITDKATVGNVGNLILTEAGNLLQPAFVSEIAYSVVNAAQPNITSLGTLVSLSVDGVGNITIPGGTNGYFLQTDGNGVLDWAAAGIPGGSDKQVQFNDDGLFNGDAALTFNIENSLLSTENLSVSNIFLAPNANIYGVTESTVQIRTGTDGSGNPYTIMDQGPDFLDAYVSIDTIGYDSSWSWIHLECKTPEQPKVWIELQKKSDGIPLIWEFGSTGDLSTPGNVTVAGNINLPLVGKINSGGIGVTNSAEFGTEVTVDGSNMINSSQVYMGAGTAESRAIVNAAGNSLMYIGVENPGFAGIVAMDPGVTSEYAIRAGGNNQIEVGAVVGPITTTEYVTGIGVLNATANINGLFANANVVVLGVGDQGVLFDTAGNISTTGNIIANNIGNISAINLDGNAGNVLYGNGTFAGISDLGNLAVSNVTIYGPTPGDPVIIGPIHAYQPWWYSIYGDLGTEINNDYGEGVAIDSNGNVFVVGGDGSTGVITFLIKYNAAGVLQWQKTFAIGTDYKSGESVAVDSTGNVYASIKDFTTGYCYLVKLDTNGNELWQVQIQTNNNDYPDSALADMAVDSGDNILLVFNYSISQISHRVLFKFNSAGTLLWQVENVGSFRYWTGISCIGTDIYVGQYPIVKYDSTGTMVWQIYPSYSDGRNMATDPSGNTYVIYSGTAQKIDPTGNPVWETDSWTNYNLNMYGVVYDTNTDSLIVTGFLDVGGQGGYELLILSLDPATGNAIWCNIFGSSSNEFQLFQNGCGFVEVHGDTFTLSGYTYSPGLSSSNTVTFQAPTNGSGQGTYGDFYYQSVPIINPNSITGSTSVASNINQTSTIPVAPGTLTISNNTYTATLVNLSPQVNKNFIFSGAGSNGSMTFPDGSIQTTAFATGADVTLGNINVTSIIANNTITANGVTSNSFTLVNNNKVALGEGAGGTNQQSSAVAIGYQTGTTNQGVGATAVGAQAGFAGQDVGAVALGFRAGAHLAFYPPQGAYSVAIGAYAGTDYNNPAAQASNSIILNATGTYLTNYTANAFVVAPIRNDNVNVGNVLFYNTSSKEVTYATPNAANLVQWTTAPMSNTAVGTAGQAAYDAGGNLFICVSANVWTKITGTTSW